MVYDPPPPYPGPPRNALRTHVYDQYPRTWDQGDQHQLRDSVTNEPVFAYDRYGQMIPAQRVTAVSLRTSLTTNVKKSTLKILINLIIYVLCMTLYKRIITMYTDSWSDSN